MTEGTRARPCACARGRGGAGCVSPSVDVRAPAPRSTRGVTVKRRGRVVKGAATRRELVDGWDSILFAAALLVSRLFPWLLRGEKFLKGKSFKEYSGTLLLSIASLHFLSAADIGTAVPE